MLWYTYTFTKTVISSLISVSISYSAQDINVIFYGLCEWNVILYKGGDFSFHRRVQTCNWAQLNFAPNGTFPQDNAPRNRVYNQ
jgi:hypothetical protein